MVGLFLEAIGTVFCLPCHNFATPGHAKSARKIMNDPRRLAANRGRLFPDLDSANDVSDRDQPMVLLHPTVDTVISVAADDENVAGRHLGR